jgi:hypothetical protein
LDGYDPNNRLDRHNRVRELLRRVRES